MDEIKLSALCYTVLRVAAVASVAAERLQIHFILVSSRSWTWQLRWSCRHKPQPGCRSVAVVNNTNSAAQRIKMDPAGCMRWHRLWKHESFYTLTPLLHPNHTHKRKFSSSVRGQGRLQVQTLRLQPDSLPLIWGLKVPETGWKSLRLSVGRGVESGMTTAWQTLRQPPNQLTLMD